MMTLLCVCVCNACIVCSCSDAYVTHMHVFVHSSQNVDESKNMSVISVKFSDMNKESDL